MTERPILFSAPMVRAILSGAKSQTRRLLKPQPLGGAPELLQHLVAHGHHRWATDEPDEDLIWKCPYGQPGDRLWVREAFAIVPRTAYRCSEGVQQTLRPDDDHDAAIYREGWTRSKGGFRWRPSIHMPRWASRITLEVTGVRVERLQDISEADAIAEGVNVHPDHHGKPRDSIYSPVQAYRDLWESINGPGSWDANPWVWCVEFRRIDAAAGEKP